MSLLSASVKTIAVAGDVTVDWNIANVAGELPGSSIWSADYQTCMSRQPGGAALLADVIATAIRTFATPTWHLYRWFPELDDVQPTDPGFHHCYTIWGSQVAGRKAWRVESFLGLDRSQVASPIVAMSADIKADVVVIDDAALGYREDEQGWLPLRETDAWQPWVVLKMARPIVQGRLWECLYSRHARRLIVVMTVNDLRLSEVQISRQLSWERTAQDLVEELTYNPKVNALSQCAHVVVSFGPAGAMLLSSPTENAPRGVRRLFFDRKVVEGMWERDYPGSMIGYTTCLTAGIVREILRAPDSLHLDPGIHTGLHAMRTLHREGYANVSSAMQRPHLAFPTAAVVEALADQPLEFASADVPVPLRFDLLTAPPILQGTGLRKPWTILHDQCRDDIEEVAAQTAIHGAETTLEGVPLGKFGSLLTVDRQEIESFRSIQSSVSEYCRRSNWGEPLSIAIFGAPGSGKSFGIVQVAKAVEPERIAVRQFNLSQFDSPADLMTALHSVRDIGLSGKIPLVFWDEFDTMLDGKPWGWLRYFLAPMQDGKFQEGQTTHAVGRAVFVFAGSTSYRMGDFGRQPADIVTPSMSADQADVEKARAFLDESTRTTAEFRAAKGPDFVSRLKGSVDILGPNPHWLSGETATAPYHMIRRAILLRSILRNHAPNVFEPSEDREDRLNIDPGVLRAFLRTRIYRHGVRSMESIIAMSLLADKRRFEQSSLPAQAQLDLHVDGEDFLRLMHQIELPETLVDTMAQAVHEVYSLGQAGASSYEDLTVADKAQNRAYVREIPNKLAQINMTMTPATGLQPAVVLTDEDVELLAEREHLRWVKTRLAEGWRHAQYKDKENRLHPDLLPWRSMLPSDLKQLFSQQEQLAMGSGTLPEAERETNRRLIRGIPDILASAGQALITLQPCVRIGAAGHRFLAELGKIEAGIDEALRHIAERFPGRSFTVLSPLAEGADRIIVQRALIWPGARLVAPLPLPQMDYETDFEQPESLQEFRRLLAQARPVIELPPAQTREEAYLAIDRWIVSHCDVLLVVWDGLPAQGQAGTGTVVRQATELGKPVAWVHAGNRRPGTEEPTSLGADQGRMEWLNAKHKP